MAIAEAQAFHLVAGVDKVVFDLAPLQGLWTQEQYLALTDYSRCLLEFTDGVLDAPPMPTDRHQTISGRVCHALFTFIEPRGGTVIYAPLRLQIRPGAFREPDLLLLRDTHDPRRQNRFWLGADCVVEIISPDDPERDTQVKRLEYAQARIPEYWLVDPRNETITVLTLVGQTYSEHGVFGRGQPATSVLLPGFAVQVTEVFEAR